MSRSRLAVPLAIVATVVVAVAVLRTSQMQRDLERTTAEIAALRAGLERVSNHQVDEEKSLQLSQFAALAGAATTTTSMAPSAAAAHVPPAPSQQQRRDELRVRHEQLAELCSTTHAAEARDPAWSDTAARTLRDKYSGDAFRDVQLAVDCRSTMCRIDFAFSDADAGHKALRALLSSPAWDGKRFYHLDGDSNEGFCYVSRPGHELPALPPAAA